MVHKFRNNAVTSSANNMAATLITNANVLNSKKDILIILLL